MKTRGRPPYPGLLTPREQEVHTLLRKGLTNPEIAERMGISLDGAKYHVSSIMSKLGVISREEAALVTVGKERPWWAVALAPPLWLWKKASVVAQSPSALAAGAAGGLSVAVVGSLALIAFLLVTGAGDNGQSEAGSLATPTGRSEPVVVTMNEVGGSGASGTATLSEDDISGVGPGDQAEVFTLIDIPTALRPGVENWEILPWTCATRPENMPTGAPGIWGGVAGLARVSDGFHHIVVYDIEANPGAVVSCGDIPAVSPDDGTARMVRPDFVQLAMSESGGSGVAGDVTLWGRHDGVGIAAVTNGAPGWHAFHIHSGTCATPGPIEALIANLDGEPTEEAGMEGLVQATELATLQDGNHYLDVHAEAIAGATLSCGDIPAGTPADGTTPTRKTHLVQFRMYQKGGLSAVADVVLWETHCHGCTDIVGNSPPIDLDGVAVAADFVARPDPGPLAIHIHTGSCANPSPFEIEFWGSWDRPEWLGNEGGAGVDAGNPSYQGFAPIALATLQDGDHYLHIHEEIQTPYRGTILTEFGAVLGCADIPEQ